MLYTDRDQILHGVKVMISVFKKKESICLFRCDVYLEFLNGRRDAYLIAALIRVAALNRSFTVHA